MNRKSVVLPLKRDVFFWFDKYVKTLERLPECPHTLVEMFWHWNKTRRRNSL